MRKINRLITQYSDLIRMMEAYRDGECVQFTCKASNGWYDVNEYHDWLASFEYRIKPKEPAIIVPWTVLSDDIIAVVMGPSGSIYAYKGEIPLARDWGWRTMASEVFDVRLVKGVVANISKDRWRESLTLRPSD